MYFTEKNAQQWFSDLNVDMEKIFEITRHILYLYEIWKTYDEKDQIKDILSRINKPRLSGPAPSSSSQQSGSSINNQVQNQQNSSQQQPQQIQQAQQQQQQ